MEGQKLAVAQPENQKHLHLKETLNIADGVGYMLLDMYERKGAVMNRGIKKKVHRVSLLSNTNLRPTHPLSEIQYF